MMFCKRFYNCIVARWDIGLDQSNGRVLNEALAGGRGGSPLDAEEFAMEIWTKFQNSDKIHLQFQGGSPA